MANSLGRSLIDRLRRLRHKPDSILHERRRRAALRSLAGPVPSSVLFVCHGNICRSPFAMAAFARALPTDVAANIMVDSVGFIGPGRKPPSTGLAVAMKRGIDLSRHRSKVVTAELLRGADLVVVMGAEQARGVRNRLATGSRSPLILGDLDPEPITRRTILDPWEGDESVFELSYSRIERCVREMARVISHR